MFERRFGGIPPCSRYKADEPHDVHGSCKSKSIKQMRACANVNGAHSCSLPLILCRCHRATFLFLRVGYFHFHVALVMVYLVAFYLPESHMSCFAIFSILYYSITILLSEIIVSPHLALLVSTAFLFPGSNNNR